MKVISSAGFGMERKNSNTSRAFLFILILFTFEFFESVAEVCQKIDDCSCKKSNGKVINLREIDGGSTPAFKNIKDLNSWRNFLYSWNPCTKFTEGDGCNNVLMCQQETHITYPLAATVSDFKVNSDGTTSIIYQKITFENHARIFELILQCDENKYPGEIDHVKEVVEYPSSAYSTTLTSKCACDDGCHSPAKSGSSIGISIGSILLIVFFVLLIVYVIGGILINKYKLGVENMPEMCPNYQFWAGIPSLIKDGIVFTYGGIKTACSSLCQKCSNDTKYENMS